MARAIAQVAALAVVATTIAGTGAAADSKAANGQAANEVAPLGFTASYAVYTGGLHTIDFELGTTLSAGHFRAHMSAAPSAVLARLIPWALEASSSGRRQAAGFYPQHHRSADWWRGEQRWVEIDYRGGAPRALRAEPPVDGDPWRGIPGAALVGALDPVSAVAAIVLSNADGVLCPPRVPVFDGKRRFDIVLEPLPPHHLKARGGSYGGPVQGCRLTFEQVAGKADDDEFGRRPIIAWFADLPGDGPMVPVRLEMRTKYGPTIAHLIHLRRPDGTIAFGAPTKPRAGRQSARR